MVRLYQPLYQRCAILAALTLALACSSSSILAPIPIDSLNGKWTPKSAEVPGLVYQFTLVLQGSNITGSGQWSVGTSQSGTVSVAGTGSATSITLDLTLGHESPGTLPFLVEHFVGQLTSSTSLSGQLTFAGGSAQQTYTKVGQ